MSNSESMLLLNELSKPKSSMGIITLPCGYIDEKGELHTEVEIREITGNEEDMLMSANIPASKKPSALLAACTKRVGSYSGPSAVNLIIPKLTVGDRMFLMVMIRRISIGDAMPQQFKCPNANCKFDIKTIIDLNDLEIKSMPDPMRRSWDFELPSGTKGRMRVLTGADEERIQTYKNRNDILSFSMMSRIDHLNGNPPTLAQLKAMTLRDREALRVLSDEPDGGVDTDFDVTCPSCGEEFTEEVELGQAAFFFPSLAQKASKSRSSV